MGRRFARVLGLLFGLEYLDADAGVYVGVLAVACDGVGVRVAGVGEDGCDGVVDGLGHAYFLFDDNLPLMRVSCAGITPRCSRYTS